MSQEMITMLLGLATTIFGGLMGWVVGKRKQNAESSLIEVEAMEAIKEFYKGALNDTNKTLQEYIELGKQNRREIESLQKQVDFLLKGSCSKPDCENRVKYYTFGEGLDKGE